MLNLGLFAEMFNSKVLNQNVTTILKNKKGVSAEISPVDVQQAFIGMLKRMFMRRCTVSKSEGAD